MTAERRAALAGIRVVDLSHQAAGPWCTSLLGDLGADVIKVEKPGRGDGIRYADRTGRLPPEIGGLNFQGLNRNKRGIDRKSTRLNSSHVANSYAVFCLKKKND